MRHAGNYRRRQPGRFAVRASWDHDAATNPVARNAQGRDSMEPVMHPSPTLSTAVPGGGCFWCVDAVFRGLQGVHEVEPGCAGG